MVDGHVIKPCHHVKLWSNIGRGMSDEWCNQSHLEKLNHGFQWHGHFRLRLDGEGSTPPAKDSQALKGSGWFRRERLV